MVRCGPARCTLQPALLGQRNDEIVELMCCVYFEGYGKKVPGFPYLSWRFRS